MDMNEKALDKFLRYVVIDTQSRESSDTTPSTAKQFNLANLLVKELYQLGLSYVSIDEHCYVMATLPSNLPENHPAKDKVPTIGFIAHVDTSPDTTGENVKPQVITYNGGDIVLPGDTSVIIRESENPKLKQCIGHTLVTTDGTTLLGADNKSGITSIMTSIQTLINHPEILHGEIKIAFTPDEEIGQGTKFFDMEKFGCYYAYTVDGEMPGELNRETFSANSAIVRIYGRDIHPGYAKDIMINSIRIMADLISMLPKHMSPETTTGYQPYIHPHVFEGTIALSTLKFLFRDFKTEGLNEQKKILENIISVLQVNNPKAKFELEIIEMYRNMRDDLERKPEGCDYLWEAAVRSGTDPYWEPIRGGTDGSRLTAMGLPTPNIYTGGVNFHSKTEFLSVDAMEKTIETIINLVQIWVEKYS
jgi:tripeptide aminopeptidase